MNANPELLRSIASELSTLSVMIRSLAQEPKETSEATVPTQESKPVEKKADPKEKLLEVRKTLAEYSQAGFTKEVRGILAKFGAKKLSEIKPEDYDAVLAEAKKLNE